MTTIVSELYQALKSVGVKDDLAERAAKSVVAIEDKESLATKADLLTTKSDLLAAIAELKTDMTWRIVVVLGMQTAVFSAIVAALKFVK